VVVGGEEVDFDGKEKGDVFDKEGRTKGESWWRSSFELLSTSVLALFFSSTRYTGNLLNLRRV